MNVHETIDRLEVLITQGRRIPLTGAVAVDQEEALELIDNLRLSLPDEVRQARWTVQEQQRLLSEAQAEAARMIAQAGDRAQVLIGQHELARRAEKQAGTLLRETTVRAEEIRRAADAYAYEVMQQLEAQLLRTVATVKKGLEALGRPPTLSEETEPLVRR